jgi:hypothetical protein
VNRGPRLVLWLAAGVAILMLGLATVVARLSFEGERAMAQSDVLFDQGRLRESLLFARRAAALYAPRLAHVRRADARLEAIAIGAESAQRQEIAILAWQAIRSSEQQRFGGFGRPSDRGLRADRRLAVLLTDDGRHGSLVEQQQFSRRVLADLEGSRPQFPYRGLVQILMLCFVSAGLVATRRSVGEESTRGWWRWLGVGLFGLGAIAWAILLVLT